MPRWVRGPADVGGPFATLGLGCVRCCDRAGRCRHDGRGQGLARFPWVRIGGRDRPRGPRGRMGPGLSLRFRPALGFRGYRPVGLVRWSPTGSSHRFGRGCHRASRDTSSKFTVASRSPRWAPWTARGATRVAARFGARGAACARSGAGSASRVSAATSENDTRQTVTAHAAMCAVVPMSGHVTERV